ncbi:hypothetical protein MJO29_006739 [Puccinia striiformis f. sp. tritici]|uniref:Small ribosomal subunit protein mS23 n=1 Tax=Puccinia striiformis f. sp. tritici PST-78 TaxID=1165861 RepID=A0A0L0VLK0_9BASI|nr:hypothetical protein Pst134EA_011942 [Puccinia striiformis f. sp. tritici]KAH9468318.1 hypothetical protein Pst134EA_011942 [Puccinia striiformis f. sp. tritici]KAI7958522.1 hypothetical protein MJO29_006739 [Puccinia striiformis f. sp. tritici]KAI9619492.1 hypothetical protein H4Q26_014255 [Puccinia striiformis f. sp. tritici PST-130]KNF00087.1 hypothetical protein PSTG_06709 [Puccinia striiformis f. sp. tritici PST-78]
MPRHHPILVHKQISASLEYGLLKQPPRSYPALINYPPNPTPSQDALSNQKKKNMEPIKWILKDKLRKAFFRDHPFEAYRPVSLVEESAQHLVNKVNRDHSNIDRLDQISCKPSPEDCIEYAERLYVNKGYNLNQAYKISVSEFRTLRFEEQIRTSFARQEAEYYSTPPNTNRAEDIQSDKKTDGHVWGRDLIKRSVEIQDKFIIESNAKSTRKSIDRSNSRSALPSKTVDDHNLQNRLIGSRVKNDVRIPIHDHLKFNQSINSELIKKSKRLSTIS